jgi:hypothetical protein
MAQVLFKLSIKRKAFTHFTKIIGNLLDNSRLRRKYFERKADLRKEKVVDLCYICIATQS